MSQIIPLISSGLAGPLGVLHLPRFWQKASLAAVGKDHPDYPAGAPGYDQMTMDALELDHDEVFKFSLLTTKQSSAISTKTPLARTSSPPSASPTLVLS